MEHKKEYVQECFNTIADNYDQMNNLMTWGMLKGWQKLVMSKTKLKSGDKALDVCCGTGEMAFQMKEIVGTGRGHGTGFFRKYARRGAEKIGGKSAQGLKFCPRRRDEPAF